LNMRNLWLLEKSALHEMTRRLEMAAAPAPEQQAKFSALQAEEKKIDVGEYPLDGGFSVDGDGTATITVRGVLTEDPDFWSWLFFGNTTYTFIRAAVAEAAQRESIERVVFDVNSPGGNVIGWVPTLDAIHALDKPTEAVVSGMAASAAYGIVTQTGRVTATNRGAMFGSVGVVQTFFIDGDVVDITSTDAPDKRPDVTTEEGLEAVKRELDAWHAIFVEAVARGRNTTVEDVNSNYGRGGILLACVAEARGMIDSSQTVSISPKTNNEATNMDEHELKTKHPETFRAIHDQGIASERDRVTAHLIMGEKTGAMDIASKAIQEGEGMTATLQAKYLTAGLNAQDQAAREEEEGEGTVKPDEETGESTAADQVADKVAKIMGSN